LIAFIFFFAKGVRNTVTPRECMGCQQQVQTLLSHLVSSFCGFVGKALWHYRRIWPLPPEFHKSSWTTEESKGLCPPCLSTERRHNPASERGHHEVWWKQEYKNQFLVWHGPYQSITQSDRRRLSMRRLMWWSLVTFFSWSSKVKPTYRC